jgi:cytochrome c551
MAIAAALAFILVGAGVFAVAMRGGPRKRGAGAPHLADRTSNRLVGTVAVVLLAFGIAVPTLVLAFNGANRASIGPGGVSLNTAEQHGRYLFSEVCSSCHTLSGADAVARIGPNLDILQPPYALVLNAIEQGRARGMGDMPAGLYQGRDAQDVARFVSAVAGH